MARPPKHPVDVKLKIVLSVLQRESTQAEAARGHGVSETSFGKWQEQFVDGGRGGLEHGSSVARPTSREARLVHDLTRALGEAHVEPRALKRGGPAGMGFAELDALRVDHELSISRFCRAVGLPARTYYDRRARHQRNELARGPLPTPARAGIRAIVVQVALKCPMWGHRKIAWLCRHEHALDVGDATCLRILREPARSSRSTTSASAATSPERVARAFVELPTRRNRSADGLR